MFDRQYKYAIRKTLLGVGSVAVGSLLIGGGVASAEEMVDYSGEDAIIEVVEPVLDNHSVVNDEVMEDIPVIVEEVDTTEITVSEDIPVVESVEVEEIQEESLIDEVPATNSAEVTDDSTLSEEVNEDIHNSETTESSNDTVVDTPDDNKSQSTIQLDAPTQDDSEVVTQDQGSDIVDDPSVNPQETPDNDPELKEGDKSDSLLEIAPLIDDSAKAVRASVNRGDYVLSVSQVSGDENTYVGDATTHRIRIDNKSGELIPPGTYLEVLARKDETKGILLGRTVHGDAATNSEVDIDGARYLRRVIDIRDLMSGGYQSITFDYLMSDMPNQNRTNSIFARLMGADGDVFDNITYEVSNRRKPEDWVKEVRHRANYNYYHGGRLGMTDPGITPTVTDSKGFSGYFVGGYDETPDNNAVRRSIPGNFVIELTKGEEDPDRSIMNRETLGYTINVPDGFKVSFRDGSSYEAGIHKLPLSIEYSNSHGYIMIPYNLQYVGDLGQFTNGVYRFPLEVTHQSADHNGGEPYILSNSAEMELVVLDQLGDLLENKLEVDLRYGVEGGIRTPNYNTRTHPINWINKDSYDNKERAVSSLRTNLLVSSNNLIMSQETPINYIDHYYYKLPTGEGFIAPQTARIQLLGVTITDDNYQTFYVNSEGDRVSNVEDGVALRVSFDEDFQLRGNSDTLSILFSHQVIESSSLRNDLFSYNRTKGTEDFTAPVYINYSKTQNRSEWSKEQKDALVRVSIHDRSTPMRLRVEDGDLITLGWSSMIDLGVSHDTSTYDGREMYNREFKGGYELIFTVPSGVTLNKALYGNAADLILLSDDGDSATYKMTDKQDVYNKYLPINPSGLEWAKGFALITPTLRALRYQDENGNYSIPIKVELDWDRNEINSHPDDILTAETVYTVVAPEGLVIESNISGEVKNPGKAYDQLLPDEEMNIFVSFGNFNSGFELANQPDGYNTFMSVLPNKAGIGYDGQNITKSTTDVVLTDVPHTIDERFEVYATTDTLQRNKRTGDYSYRPISNITDLSKVTALQFRLKDGESIRTGEILDFGYTVQPTERLKNTKAQFASQSGFSEGTVSDYQSLPTNVVTAKPSELKAPYRVDWFQRLGSEGDYSLVSKESSQNLLIPQLDRSQYQVEELIIRNEDGEVVFEQKVAKPLQDLFNPSEPLTVNLSTFTGLGTASMTVSYNNQPINVGIDVSKDSSTSINPLLSELIINLYEQLDIDIDESSNHTPIPFKTETRESATLPKGEERVIQQGVNGEVVTTTRSESIYGISLGDPTVSSQTKDPVNHIVEVGTGTVSETVTQETVEIPYETERIEDISLPKGQEVVDQPGVPGIKTITTTTPTLNGKPSGDPVVKEEITKDPVNEVIRVGTGVVSEDVTQETVEIDFETERVEDINLPAGKEVIEVKGQVGQKVVTTTTPTLNGKPSGEPVVKEAVTKDPVNEVIRVGTGIVSEDVTQETVDIAFETERIETPDLPQGEERVVQVGVTGEKVVTTTTPTLNGKPSGEPVIEEVVTKEAVNEIIEVGVGTVSEDIQTETVEIAFETEVVYDESLPEGESVTEQVGELGEKVITTTTPLLNGEPSGDPVVTEEVTKNPVKEIVRVGTGVIAEEVTKETAEVSYETERIDNPELPEGEERVVQQGQAGEKVITITTPLLNGEPSGDSVVEETVTKEPVKEIVHIGTGIVSEDITEETAEIPYETEKIDDPTLPEGEQSIITQGQPGEKTIVTTTPTLNGEPSGEPVVEEIITKEPVKEIVHIGTGIVSEDITEETAEIPYETERIDNPELPEGEERVVQVGQVGEKVIITTTPTLNGEPSGESVVEETITKDPVNEIIEVGTGIVSEDITEETVEIPYETEKIDDPTLPEGEQSIITQGQPGEKTIVTTTPTLNGELSGEPVVEEIITKEPVGEIIHIGTGVVSEDITTEDEIIEVEVEIIYDEDLPRGTTQVEREGTPGVLTTITTVPLLNGEPSDDPVITQEVTKEMETKIIRVGTGIVPEGIQDKPQIDDKPIIQEEVKEEPQIEEEVEVEPESIVEESPQPMTTQASSSSTDDKQLPETGESSLTMLSGLTSLLSGFGLVGASRRRRKEDEE